MVVKQAELAPLMDRYELAMQELATVYNKVRVHACVFKRGEASTRCSSCPVTIVFIVTDTDRHRHTQTHTASLCVCLSVCLSVCPSLPPSPPSLLSPLSPPSLFLVGTPLPANIAPLVPVPCSKNKTVDCGGWRGRWSGRRGGAAPRAGAAAGAGVWC